MARHWKIAIAVLGVLALVGLVSFPSLLRNVLRLRRAQSTEQQARREIEQQRISTPTDTREKAQIFWASESSPGTLEAHQVDLALSKEPAERAKQVITVLIEQVPNPAERTLPADTELLELYILQDGTAIADFSEALAAQTPSGILSEQMAVDSIVRTLAANVSSISRLKILVHGQESDTLAGHLDLNGFFPVMSAEAGVSSAADEGSTVPASSPVAVPPTDGASAGRR
jgi:type II secretory pathway pseudopilin PulG